MQQHVFMGVESVAFKSGIQCLLVEANSGANPEMTQKKGINLCSAVDVPSKRTNGPMHFCLSFASVRDSPIQTSLALLDGLHETRWQGMGCRLGWMLRQSTVMSSSSR
jgi:hypothetical protein